MGTLYVCVELDGDGGTDMVKTKYFGALMIGGWQPRGGVDRANITQDIKCVCGIEIIQLGPGYMSKTAVDTIVHSSISTWFSKVPTITAIPPSRDESKSFSLMVPGFIRGEQNDSCKWC